MHPRKVLLNLVARLLAVAASIAGGWCAEATAGEGQAWQWVDLTLHRDEVWRFHLYADNRIGEDALGDASSYIQVLSPRLKWRVDEHLELGFGYARLDIESLTGGRSSWQHRSEFEVNPRFSAGPWSFHHRNRLELRWRNGGGKRLPRFRTRLQAKYAWGEGVLRHLYANNEFFFDLTDGSFSENRLVPLGIGFRVSEKATMNLFYMVQSLEGGTGWRHRHVAGTFLQLSF